MFNLLEWQPHFRTGGKMAKHTFENGWSVSVLSGLDGSGIYGNVIDRTYEVAIIRPDGELTRDVSGWNTEIEVSAMMWAVSQIEEIAK